MEKFKARHPDVDVPAKKLSLLTKDELQIKHKWSVKIEQILSNDFNIDFMFKEWGQTG